MSGNFLFVLIIPSESRGWPFSSGSSLPGLISQQSSMLMYVQPCCASPLLTMASAAERTLASSTALAKQFQLFQPSGGVRAIVSPQTILNFRCSLAQRRWSRAAVTTYSPRCCENSGDLAGFRVKRQARQAGRRRRTPSAVRRWREWCTGTDGRAARRRLSGR